jgi:hypothetical protein
MKQTNNLVTKPFLKKELNKLKRDLRRELVGKDEFLEKFDEVLGELKGLREDFDIFSGKYGVIHDRIDNHEERIVRLEGNVA